MFVFTQPNAFQRRAGLHPAWTRAVERLLDDPALPRATGTQVPAMDLSETASGYHMSLDLPGIVREQVKVTIDGRVVSVEAAPVVVDAEPEGARVVYRERSTPRFARSVTLPSPLDAAASKAHFANGVLTLELVKQAVTGPTTLSVA